MSPRDLALYKDLGAVGERLTGYPTISTYEDFTPDKSKARHGSLKDWVYEEMGIICFSTELWDLERTAGVPKVGYYNLYPRDDETTRKVFRWVVENVGEHGFRDWEAFDHPQLGPVEVGGMVYIWSYRNPPGALLPEICHNNVMFNLQHAAAAPRVAVDEVRIEALGADLHKVTAVVSNHGYLPTNLSDVAVQNGVAKPVTVTLDCAGAEIEMNPAQVALGNLAGRNERKYAYSNWGQQWSPVSRKVEWLVRAPDAGASVTVTSRSEKGVAKPVLVTIAVEDGEVAMNPVAVELGNLAGRNERRYAYSNWGQQWSPVTKKVEWLVRARGSGAVATVTARSEKGGTHRARIEV
jgi:hypothetical protein